MALSMSWPRGAGPARAAGRPRYGLIAFGFVLALAVVLLQPLLAAAVLAAVALACVIMVRPILAVYLLVFSVPYESLHEVQLGGLNATLTEFLAFCGGAAFLMRTAIDGQMRVRWSWWRWPLLIFVGAMILSISGATDVKLSIKEILKLGEMLLTYLLVLKYVDTPARLRRLIWLVVLAALSQALMGLGQTAAHFGPASFARGGVLRGSGTFDQPNPFAGYLNLTLPILIAAVMMGVPLVGGLTGVSTLLLAAALLLSVSRGALLALIAAVVVMVTVYARRARPLVGAGAIAVFAVAAGTIVGILPASLTQSVTADFGLTNIDVANPTAFDWPVAERLAHMLAGLQMFFAHPWLGVGIGNYPAAYATLYQQHLIAPVWANPLGHAHNYYINIAAEAGVVGLAAFLIVLISAFVIAVKLYRRAADPLARALALGTLGVFVTVAVHSGFDDIFVHAMEAQLALVMAMATVACRLSVARPEMEAR